MSQISLCIILNRNISTIEVAKLSTLNSTSLSTFASCLFLVRLRSTTRRKGCMGIQTGYNQKQNISKISILKKYKISISHQDVPYSREQKHVLLFRKSDFLFFKVSNTNMAHIFFRNKTFLFVKIERF